MHAVITEVKGASKQPSAAQIMIDQKQLENVGYFNRLCSMITNDAKCMPWRKQLPQFFATYGRRRSCRLQKTHIFSNTTVRTSNVAFCNMLIYYSAVWFASCPTAKLEDCLLQAVRDWLLPNDLYISRTTPLTSKRCILYIYSANVGTENFKHAV